MPDRPAPRPAEPPPFAVAYVAPAFPTRSETFVYREVRELRRRGWAVRPFGLRPPTGPTPGELADVAAGAGVVYRRRGAWLASAVAEAVAHPIRSALTLGTAALDAIAPGEPTGPVGRGKLIAQAVAGLSLARSLRRAGDGPPVGHVHAHFAHSPAGVAMCAARQLGVPFSFTGHANDLFDRRSLLAHKVGRAAFVACISRWHRELYRDLLDDSGVSRERSERFLIAEKRSLRSRLTETVLRKSDAAPDRRRSRRDHGKFPLVRCGIDARPPADPPAAPRDGPVRIVTVCRLVEKKGVDTLLRALARLDAPDGSDDAAWHLTVAGDGPRRPALEALSRQLGLVGHVAWRGAVDPSAVAGLLDAADVFALPCRVDGRGDKDGIPVALMEAMAAGLPVVAGDLPAVRELVSGESADDAGDCTGLLVDGADPASVAAALARLIADPSLRRRLGDAGRGRVEREFALPAAVDRLEASFRASAGETIAPPAVAEVQPRAFAALQP